MKAHRARLEKISLRASSYLPALGFSRLLGIELRQRKKVRNLFANRCEMPELERVRLLARGNFMNKRIFILDDIKRISPMLLPVVLFAVILWAHAAYAAN
jgi:hypothetical protein